MPNYISRPCLPTISKLIQSKPLSFVHLHTGESRARRIGPKNFWGINFNQTETGKRGNADNDEFGGLGEEREREREALR